MTNATGDSRVVLRDIAGMFDVAPITVSRALRRTGQVESKLEAAIIEAARQHGYSIESQFHARALRQRRNGSHVATNCICAIIRDSASLSASPFHLRLMAGVERGASDIGFELMITPSDAGLGNHRIRFPRAVVRRQVDGVVWLLSETDLKYFDEPCPVPLVSVLFSVPGVDVVAVDDHGATRAIGEHLATLGHRRVAVVGPESELAQARLAGLRAGLTGAGGLVSDDDVRMKPYVMLPDTVLPLVRDLMARRQTLPAAERFTAIAAYNDYIAVTVIRCLQDEYGLRVPQDISVTGFDNLDVVPAGMPKLTTAAMPLEDLGAEAVRMIAWRMQHPGEAPRRMALPAPLVTGETAGTIHSKQ